MKEEFTCQSVGQGTHNIWQALEKLLKLFVSAATHYLTFHPVLRVCIGRVRAYKGPFNFCFVNHTSLHQSTTGKCLICRSVSPLVFLIVNWSIWSWSQCNKTTKKEGLILHQCKLVYYVVHNNKCHVLLPNSHVCNLTSISCLFTCMFANYIPIPSEKNQLYRVFIVFQHYLTTTWKMQCKKKKSILEKKSYHKWLQITVWVRNLVVKSTEHQKHVTSRGQLHLETIWNVLYT